MRASISFVGRSSNVDLALVRTFPVRERLRLQLRAEALNLSNTPHFNTRLPRHKRNRHSMFQLQLNADGSVKNLNGFSQITSKLRLAHNRSEVLPIRRAAYVLRPGSNEEAWSREYLRRCSRRVRRHAE